MQGTGCMHLKHGDAVASKGCMQRLHRCLAAWRFCLARPVLPASIVLFCPLAQKIPREPSRPVTSPLIRALSRARCQHMLRAADLYLGRPGRPLPCHRDHHDWSPSLPRASFSLLPSRSLPLALSPLLPPPPRLSLCLLGCGVRDDT
jgi:hypothetical protein